MPKLYNHVRGAITSAKDTAEGANLSFTLLVEVGGRECEYYARMVQRRQPACTGVYDVDLHIDGKTNGIAGTWKAVLAGTAIDGEVTGILHPAGQGPRSRPVPLGVHPRFLIRPEDVRGLREKARTPWGVAMLKRLDREDWSRSSSAVGLGLLYQITGERTYADRARGLLQADIDSGWWTPLGPIHDPGQKAVEGMIAYDLIHDTCDEAYHERMREFLRPQPWRLHSLCNISRGNDGHLSNWSGLYRTGGTMAALALASDAIPIPKEPMRMEMRRLQPPEGFQPDPNEAPIMPADGGDMFKWLYAGPFNIGTRSDGLAELGGVAKARPVRGTTFKLMEKAEYQKETPNRPNHMVKGDDLKPLTKPATGSFRDIPPSFATGKNDWNKPPDRLDIWKAAGEKNFQTLYFYAVVHNDKPRHVLLQTGIIQQLDRCAYIAGRRFEHGDVFFMEAGFYPVMLPVTFTTYVYIHDREFTGIEFRLTAMSEEKGAVAGAHFQAQDTFRVAAHKALCAAYPDGRAPDLDGLLWAEFGRCCFESYAHDVIGDRGWNLAGECYTRHPARTVLPYAHAHRNATGTPPYTKPHLEWLAPLCATKTVFFPDKALMHSYGRGGGPLGVDVYARGFGLVPEDIMPGVFHAWQQTQALADAGKLQALEIVIDRLDPMSAAFMFVNWPLNPDTGKPLEMKDVKPGQNLPRVVHDEWRSSFVFRNAYRDSDDIVLLVPGKTNCDGDWGDNEYGNLRLMGLGAEWAVRGDILDRSAMTVPWIADGMNGGAPAPTRHFHASPDGSGVVTLDMTDTYSVKDRNLEGLRSVAVDYSGASGAPGLLVIVDSAPKAAGRKVYPALEFGGAATSEFTEGNPQAGRHSLYLRRAVQAAKKKMDADTQPDPDDVLADKKDSAVGTDDLSSDKDASVSAAEKASKAKKTACDYSLWQWVTPVENTVSVAKDGFTISAPNGATLQATVIVPTTPRFQTEESQLGCEANYCGDHAGCVYKRRIIRMEGENAFFVVITLQKGPAPKVVFSGEGLRARATVGKRAVRFDGEKIVME